jgi:Putative zinc- or iron-chelating domain
MPPIFCIYHKATSEPASGKYDPIHEFPTEQAARDFIKPEFLDQFDIRPTPTTHTSPDSCDGCPAGCCRGVKHGRPPFDTDEISRVPTELLSTIKDSPGIHDRGVCSWLDLETRKCKHYDHRPQGCRDFPRGSVACHGTRQVHEIN